MLGSTKAKWDPLRPETHVPGDPDCDCYAYTPEGRAGIEAGLEDCRAERVFRASIEDLDALMDGRLTIHDIHLREFLATTEGAEPRGVEVSI